MPTNGFSIKPLEGKPLVGGQKATEFCLWVPITLAHPASLCPGLLLPRGARLPVLALDSGRRGPRAKLEGAPLIGKRSNSSRPRTHCFGVSVFLCFCAFLRVSVCFFVFCFWVLCLCFCVLVVVCVLVLACAFVSVYPSLCVSVCFRVCFVCLCFCVKDMSQSEPLFIRA